MQPHKTDLYYGNYRLCQSILEAENILKTDSHVDSTSSISIASKRISDQYLATSVDFTNYVKRVASNKQNESMCEVIDYPRTPLNHPLKWKQYVHIVI